MQENLTRIVYTQRRLYINNLLEQYIGNQQKYHFKDHAINSVPSLPHTLINSFNWADTPEKAAFWGKFSIEVTIRTHVKKHHRH